MRGRRLILLAWLLGAGLAAFFLVGCCVLPFHGLLHRVMPLCQVAAALMGGHEESGHEHPATPAGRQDAPAATREASCQPAARPGLPVVLALTADRPLDSPARYRTLVSLGAVRLDEDVGVRLAVLDTLRI